MINDLPASPNYHAASTTFRSNYKERLLWVGAACRDSRRVFLDGNLLCSPERADSAAHSRCFRIHHPRSQLCAPPQFDVTVGAGVRAVAASTQHRMLASGGTLVSSHILASVIQWTVWGVSMALVTGWLSRSRSRAPAPSQAGVLVLPTSILIIGIVSVVFWLAIVVISNTVGKNSTSTLGMRLIFCLFCIASVPLISSFYLSRHRVSQSGVDYGEMFGARRTFAWSEVMVVRYSRGMGWFNLELESGYVAHISTMLTGLPEFARLVLAHVPREKCSDEAYALLRDAQEGKLPNLTGGA